MRAYAKMDWDGEIVTTGLFGDGITTLNAWEIDIGWLNDTALALCCFQEPFGETVRLARVSI